MDKKIDRDHKAIGGKPQFNNYFINVVKNLGAPLTHELRGSKPLSSQVLAWLEEEQFTPCFNDYHAFMVAARVGKDGYVRQIAGYKTSKDDTHVQDTYHGRYSKF